MPMNYEQLLMDAKYKESHIQAHRLDVEKLTGTNEPINGKNQSYWDGYSNKVYGISAFDGSYGSTGKEILIAKDNQEANRLIQMAMDVDTVAYNIPSNGVPSWFTTVWTNYIVEQLLQTTPSRLMTHDFQQGMFGTTNVKIPTIALGGSSEPYADRSGKGDNSINVNWVDRETITLQRTQQYGDLSAAQFGMAKIDYIAKLREALNKQISIEQNTINFSGYAGVRVFGLLNDPSLNPTLVSPASIANPASSLWYYKTYAEIVADIIALVNGVISISGGNADVIDNCVLGIPPAVYAYLDRQNPLGTQSVREYIRLAYPGMKVVQVQNYQGTGSPIGSTLPNYAQLVWNRLGGQEVALNAFSSIYQSHGVVRETSYYTEKISYTVSGTIVALPFGISTMSGI